MRELLTWLTGWLPGDRTHSTSGRGRSLGNGLERLEDRVVPSTVPGSLLGGCTCPYCSGAAYVTANQSASYVASNATWPQPGGRGSAVTITYSYSNLLDGRLGGGLSAASIRAAIQLAFSRWAAVAPLNFVEVADRGPAPSDNDYSASGMPMIRLGHTSIDGPSGVLGQTYYPGSYGLAGDMHLDTSERWSLNPASGTDLIEVALHEIGHALGLDHEPPSYSGGQNAIMNPFYGGRFNGPWTSYLLADDIAGIRALYGAGTGSVRPLGAVPEAPWFRIVGNQLIVSGTGGNDTFQFIAGPNQSTIRFNGNTLTIQASQIRTVSFNGGNGNDTAILSGWTGADSIGLSGTRASLLGSNYVVQVANASTIVFHGGANDRATLIGSKGNDSLTFANMVTTFWGAGFYYRINGVRYLNVQGGAGADAASLSDTPEQEAFRATPGSTSLFSSTYRLNLGSFESVTARSSGGDYAYLYGNANKDTYVGSSSGSILSGPGYALRAYGFLVVTSYGMGGTDTATLYGQSGNDVFRGSPADSMLYSTMHVVRAVSFQTVTAIGSGGTDTGNLYDSSGADTFQGKPGDGYLYGSTYTLHALGFGALSAYSSGGDDRAYLYDSVGDDLFVSTAQSSSMSTSQYLYAVFGFGIVTASASSGYDSANLSDSTGADTLLASGIAGTLTSKNLERSFSGFDLVTVDGTSGGTNRKNVSGLSFTLDLEGRWS